MPSLWAENLVEHRSLVLDRLLDAFGEQVEAHGYAHVTLAAVAQQAGLARSAVYNYVRDRQDLLVAHARRDLEVAARHLDAALSAAGSPVEQLTTYVAAAFVGFASGPLRGHDPMGLLDEAKQRELVEHLRPMRDALTKILSDGLDDGSFGGGSVAELAEFVVATINGYRVAVARGQLDPHEVAARSTRLLLRALRPAT
ncbi:TetR/AcrR family transcriptional regulator [Egicoccus halophilus]|uniref:HTH tetR-type domain-containing protein n=1 Tax=Egicoccus halophilus TaxID=1670830 RepID=A0A8J3A5H2_9ACTN|nr:TetR/AcrR family transcriptional regulator [Egicoccus halophilus]GGI03489.1 hypothetical protein GCM10011354_04300 [Egicoccus halophilus]